MPDDVDSPEVAGSTGGDLTTAFGVIRGKQYADAHGLRYDDQPEDPRASFVQFATTPSGDVLFVGVLSRNSDGDYKVGRTKAVLVRLDPKGKLRWRRELTAKGFLDYGGGKVAVTSDGGCVVQVASYVHPGRHPVVRLVRLDAKGKILWDRRFRGSGGVESPIGDRFELLPDGSVSITGRYYEDRYERVKHTWKGRVDAQGQIVLDQVDPEG
ncbi:MAG: hypothetical protein IRZ16_22985 [Myxococcaceae bacterium]|nr:hypothetical protein [Myxococcaceae bacterium]